MVITSICGGASNHDIRGWVQPWLLPPPYMVDAEEGVAISALVHMIANSTKMLTLSTMVVQE